MLNRNAKVQLDKYYTTLFKETQCESSSSWEDIIGETQLTYIDPALERRQRDLLLCCDFMACQPCTLSADQLAEALECIDLLISHDAALLNWLERDIQYQKAERIQEGSKILPDAIDFDWIFKECFQNELDNCELLPISQPKQFASGQLVRTIAFLDIPRDTDGLPYHLRIESRVGKEESVWGTFWGNQQQVAPISARGIHCLLKMPETWTDEDVLNFKAKHYGIPVLVIGRWTPTEDISDISQYSDLAGGNFENIVQPYAILICPDEYRKSQLLFGFHLEEVIGQSKLELQVPFPQEDWPSTAVELYNEARQTIVKADSVDEVVKYLNTLDERLGVSWISSPDVQKPSEAWRAGKTNQTTFYALVLNLLAKISLVDNPSLLRQTTATLHMSRLAGDDLQGDEGDYLHLIMHKDGNDFLLDPCDKLSESDHIAVTKLSVRLPVPDKIALLLPDTEDLYKNVIGEELDATLQINPTSSLSLVSVGEVDKTIKDHFRDSVAAIIELEDRHTRTAKLPEPWQYNLRKVMEVVASNPNIRYLVALGEREFCDNTITYLEELNHPSEEKDLPRQYFPSNLVKHFRRQVKQVQVCEGDPRKEPRLYSDIRRLIRSSYQEQTNSNFHEVSCIIPSYSKPIEVSYEPSRLQREEPLLEVNSTEVVAETIAQAYPRVVESVRCFGKTKVLPDKYGRFYRELLSFRVIIEDSSTGFVPLGFDSDDLARNFQEQWLQTGGLFHDRMTGTAGFVDPNTGEPFDQISEGIVPRIVGSVEKGIVSRSIILNVHHPARDRKSALGLNTVHLTVEKVSQDIPRWLLHGSYIWRTVDVLFGLPYNIYAAAQFLNYIVDRCNKELDEDTRYGLSAGKVIIVALNLHLYEGTLDQEISRRIVEQMASCA